MFHSIPGATVTSFGGNENLSILFDDLKCSGLEFNLLECRRSHPGSNDCTHLEDVGVTCAGKSRLCTCYMHVACMCAQQPSTQEAKFTKEVPCSTRSTIMHVAQNVPETDLHMKLH